MNFYLVNVIGTGKTVTVVEAVIQIFRLDPQSR